MKKILILVFIGSSILSTVSCTKEQMSKTEAVQEAKPELSGIPWLLILTNLPPIDIDIKFGERRAFVIDGQVVTSDCVESGLCDVSIDIGGVKSEDGDGMTTDGKMGFEENILYLRVSESNLVSENINELNGSVISLDEELPLDDEIAIALGLTTPYIISAGDKDVGSRDGYTFVRLN